MKKYKIIVITLMLLTLAVTCISFGFLDDVIPTHMGIDGTPDRYGSKYYLLFFVGISIVIGVIMLVVAQSKKVSDNYRKYLLITSCVMETLFLCINIISIIYALTYASENKTFDFSKIIVVIVGLMLIIMGNFMPKIEKNRTLGFKTRTSMYNEVTWRKTHRFTGFAAVIAGILAIILCMFFEEEINFIILMVLIFGFIIATYIASICYYHQEKKLGH